MRHGSGVSSAGLEPKSFHPSAVVAGLAGRLMELVLVLAVVGVALFLILGPLREHRPAADPRRAERAELEAAKEAKFREIRDAELDFRTGKLSREDWRTLDSGLRAEAVELLRRLDALDGVPEQRN
jgi:hypothetical protein